MKPEEAAEQIKSIKKMRNGGVLIELRNTSTEGISKFTEKLKTVTEEEGSMRKLVPRATLEIRDVDSYTTTEEVEEAVRRELKDTGKEILNTWVTKPNRREQCLALITIDEVSANKLLNIGRIRIGLMYSAIRRAKTVTRCYRCLNFGHTKWDCKRPDRSKACYKCGTENHLAKNCPSTPHCFLCEEARKSSDGNNHIAGSRRCAVFREILKNTP